MTHKHDRPRHESDTRDENPPESAHKQEVAEQPVETREELAARFAAAEAQALQPAKERVGMLQQIAEHPAAPWIVRVGLAMRLMGAETAFAGTVADTRDAGAVRHAEGVEVPPKSHFQIRQYFDRSFDTDAGISYESTGRVVGRNEGIEGDSPYDVRTELTREDFADRQPVLLPDDAHTLTLRRAIQPTDLHPLASGDHPWKVTDSETEARTETAAFQYYVDADGNTVMAGRLTETDREYGIEMVIINLPTRYATPGQEARAVPLNVDLCRLGNEPIDGAFYQQEVPYLGMIEHSPVYSSDFTAEEAQQLMVEGQGAIEWGVMAAARGYGLTSEELVQRVHLVDTDYVQAQADDNGTITVHDSVLRDPSIGLEARRHIFTHEAEHVADARLGVSEDPRFQAAFDRIPAELRSQFNESEYHGAMFGGHVDDSDEAKGPVELFASFSAGMDDPHSWQQTLSGKSPEFRAAYLDVAKTTREILAERGVAHDAPKMKELDLRIAFLEGNK
jgi:hypothetical protein